MLSTTFMLLVSGAFLMLRLGETAGSFPRPLPAREERRYVEAWLAGDVQARNILIEHNLRLVVHIVKKYYAASADAEDLISIGTVGLIKGVSSYRPEKGVRLATYASKCIENAILTQRNNRKLRWRNGRLLRQNGACWREWESAAIFCFPMYRVR